jgi:anaerobic selenocysteine-containing dehydrogenase
MAEKITACFMCACNCGLVMELDDGGRIEKIRGDRDHPLTRGFTCNKGRRQARSIDSPHRLTSPKKRVDGQLVDIGWDEAIEEIAGKLKRIRKRSGGRSVALVVGGSPHPMFHYVMAFAWLRRMGSRNMYSPVSLEFTSKYLANQKMFGCSYFEGHPDFAHARTVVLVGTNTYVSHPLKRATLKKLSKDPERRMVVVDPRRTETARMADQHLSIRPSTDIYLILSMLQVITSEQLHDPEFTSRHCRGFDELTAATAPFTPEVAEGITDIPADEIRSLARRFADAGPSLLYYDMGVVANRHSTLLSWAVKSLMLITGNMGVRGGVLFNPTLSDPNDEEPWSYAGRKYRSRVRDYPEITGHMPVTVLQDEILTPGKGQIRAAIVDGCNPLRSYTDATKMERAFDDLELLVSIDPFLTEVGRRAHYVLPSCSFYEQDNISCSYVEIFPRRFAQYTPRIRPPLGDSRPEWEIYRDLIQAMGLPLPGSAMLTTALVGALRLGQRALGAEGDLLELFHNQRCKAAGFSLDDLAETPHGRFLDDGEPTEMMSRVKHRDGKARLAVPEFIEAIEGLPRSAPPRDTQHPYLLSTTCRTSANINTMYRDQDWLRRHPDCNRLQMNTADAAGQGISEGDRVVLSNDQGRETVQVTLSDDPRPGTVFLSHGHGLLSRDPDDHSGDVQGVAAAHFVPDADADAFSGMPFLSGIPCRVDRCPDE